MAERIFRLQVEDDEEVNDRYVAEEFVSLQGILVPAEVFVGISTYDLAVKIIRSLRKDDRCCITHVGKLHAGFSEASGEDIEDFEVALPNRNT